MDKKQKPFLNVWLKKHLVIEMVCDVGKEMPRTGSRKLANMLADSKLPIGHDARFDILVRNGLLVRRRRNMIGSGPIEAARRSVLQQRMKLSGQRWSIYGCQAIANLRCYQKANVWHMGQESN